MNTATVVFDTSGYSTPITVLSNGVREFLKAVFDQDRDEAAIDTVYDWFDVELKAGRISKCNRCMHILREDYLDQCVQRPSLGLAFLTQTAFDRARIDAWKIVRMDLFAGLNTRYGKGRGQAVLGHLPSD